MGPVNGYYAFLTWDDAFHTIIDTIYCIIAVLQIRYVMRTRRRQHLSWLIPSGICSITTLLYRAVIDLRHSLGIRWGLPQFEAMDIWLESANVWGTWGSIVFWRMMNRGQIFGQPVANHEPATDPDSWPPPPIRRDGP
jgi:hypothetical protein